MTVEEFKEFIKNNGDEFQGLISEMGFESADDVAGLKSKRDELLKKNRDLKNSMNELESKYSSIDLDEYEKAMSAKGHSGGEDDKKTERELKRLQEQVKADAERAANLERALNNTLIKSELKTAFDAVGVDSVHKDLLTNAYIGKAKVEFDGDRRVVYIDDGSKELAANEYFKEWAGSDSGKPYLAKATNKGSGAAGFNSSANTISRKEFDALSPVDRISTIKSGTKITD